MASGLESDVGERYYLTMQPRWVAKGMLGARHNLSQKSSRIAPTAIHLGVIGAGVVLGLVSFPYVNESPLAMMAMGASGSVIAVGLLLLAYDLLKEKQIVEITN